MIWLIVVAVISLVFGIRIGFALEHDRWAHHRNMMIRMFQLWVETIKRCPHCGKMIASNREKT